MSLLKKKPSRHWTSSSLLLKKEAKKKKEQEAAEAQRKIPKSFEKALEAVENGAQPLFDLLDGDHDEDYLKSQSEQILTHLKEMRDLLKQPAVVDWKEQMVDELCRIEFTSRFLNFSIFCLP